MECTHSVSGKDLARFPGEIIVRFDEKKQSESQKVSEGSLKGAFLVSITLPLRSSVSANTSTTLRIRRLGQVST